MNAPDLKAVVDQCDRVVDGAVPPQKSDDIGVLRAIGVGGQGREEFVQRAIVFGPIGAVASVVGVSVILNIGSNALWDPKVNAARQNKLCGKS